VKTLVVGAYCHVKSLYDDMPKHGFVAFKHPHFRQGTKANYRIAAAIASCESPNFCLVERINQIVWSNESIIVWRAVLAV
jgi:hypothetical protein